ncbi:MAG: hypothetical protein PHI19_06305 [Clostridia bacterium]|nr:hypothetical protein [Clostridia bacterium]
MDYSPFYCKNFYKERRKKASEVTNTSSNDNDTAIPFQNSKKRLLPSSKKYTGKRKKRNIFFLALLVLLCFAIVTLSADLFSGGTVFDKLKETFGSNYIGKNYLIVQGNYAVKNKAESEALAVRENGAAGFVYGTKNGYCVVLASYQDKKSAEAVMNKNTGVELLEITMREPSDNGLNDKQKKVCGRSLAMVLSDIDALYGIIDTVSNGTKSIESAFIELTDMRNTLLLMKEEIIENNLPEDARNAYLNIIDPLFGGLDAIVYKEPDSYFLAAIRYVLIGSIVSFGVS